MKIAVDGKKSKGEGGSFVTLTSRRGSPLYSKPRATMPQSSQRYQKSEKYYLKKKTIMKQIDRVGLKHIA